VPGYAIATAPRTLRRFFVISATPIALPLLCRPHHSTMAGDILRVVGSPICTSPNAGSAR